jgi:uncharacterized protein DUF1566
MISGLPRLVLCLSVTIAVSASGAGAITPTQKCSAIKLKAGGKYALCSAKAAAKSIRTGEEADYTGCHDTLLERFVVAETTAEGACLTAGDSTAVENLVLGNVMVLDGEVNGPRFVDNGNGTINDFQTGLMWEKKTVGNYTVRMTWVEAMSDYITLINGFAVTPYLQPGLGGHSDWRVPTVTELATLSNAASGCSDIAPCVDPIFLPQDVLDYWTSTTPLFDATEAYSVGFTNYSVSPALYVSGKYDPGAYNAPVRAVRRLP